MSIGPAPLQHALIITLETLDIDGYSMSVAGMVAVHPVTKRYKNTNTMTKRQQVTSTRPESLKASA